MKNQTALNGGVVQWTNGGSAVAAGDVVAMGDTLGVAAVAIGAGETGSVAITGVFKLPKTAADIINVGERVHFDASAGEIVDKSTTTASGDIENVGVAYKSAAASTTTVEVKLCPGNGAAQ